MCICMYVYTYMYYFLLPLQLLLTHTYIHLIFQHLVWSSSLLKINIHDNSREATHMIQSTLTSTNVSTGSAPFIYRWIHRLRITRKQPTLMRWDQHPHPHFLWFPKDLSVVDGPGAVFMNHSRMNKAANQWASRQDFWVGRRKRGNSRELGQQRCKM